MRRFEQRPTETLVLGEMLDRTVDLATTRRRRTAQVTVEDVAIEQGAQRRLAGHASVFVRRGPLAGRLRRRGETFVVDFEDVTGFGVVEQRQGAANLLAAFEELKAADLAEVIHELTPKRRLEVAAALDDERLADVLEELPEDDQVEILSVLGGERAADVLEAMQPDDAADLLAELPGRAGRAAARADGARRGRRRPPAARLRRRHRRRHDDARAGDPAARTPPSPRRWRTSAAPTCPPRSPPPVYVCRPPLETPTGTLPRPGPHPAAAARAAAAQPSATLLDKDIEPLSPGRPAGASHPPARDVQPGRRCRSSTTAAACSAWSPSTTSSTTCSPRTGATHGRTTVDREARRPSGGCRGDPRPTRRARPRAARDAGRRPRHPARAAPRGPADPAGRPRGLRPRVGAVRPVHGHGPVHRLHDGLRRGLAGLEHARRRQTCSSTRGR